MSSRKRSSIGTYNSINDPHLGDDFERRFCMIFFLLKKKKKYKSRKPGPNECIYKVRVKTGNLNNAGTDANVHLTIYGQRFNLTRRHLFNKYDAIHTENGFKFKFERNSTHIFKIIGIDVGPITHIVIEVKKNRLNTYYFRFINNFLKT